MSSEEAQISVPISKKNLLRFNIWCKISGMTQPQALAKLIEEHVPDYRMHIKQE